MSKNIRMLIGGEERTFSSVSAIVVEDAEIDNEYYDFVDKDEAGQYANLITKTITQNGTYSAQYDGVDGYSTVVVSGEADEETIYGALNAQSF